MLKLQKKETSRIDENLEEGLKRTEKRNGKRKNKIEGFITVR